MPDNPQATPQRESTGFFALGDHRVLELAGRDAAAFAQAQFMNDVAALPAGQWQWNGWLTPKGRVIALFALLKLDAGTLWLVLPDADPAELEAMLQRFVFRSRLTLAVRDDLHVAGAFHAPAAADGVAIAAGDGVELDFGAASAARTLRIDSVEPPPEASALARWRAVDLLHGWPRLPASQSGQWTPQMLSLERLGAFSLRKGCYPGQEIVARTHFLGQAKRGLALFEADAAVPVGSEVRDAEHGLGTIVSTAEANDRPLALAVVLLDRTPGAPLSAGGVALRELPLLGGLAR